MRGICTNCMGYGDIVPCSVGPEKGTQRDPYRNEILLCPPCTFALTDGRLSEFHARYGSEITVTRDDLEPQKKDGDGRVT